MADLAETDSCASPARPQPPGPTEPGTVAPPLHPMHALTTYELRDYRRRIENAIAYLDRQNPSPRCGPTCRPPWTPCSPSRNPARSWPPVRDHDVTALTAAELEHARRELAASLALARPESPVRGPILARLSAIDAELARRGGAR